MGIGYIALSGFGAKCGLDGWMGEWSGYPLDCYDYQSTCGAKKKNNGQPTRIFCTSKISWNKISDWLPIIFDFGSVNWEEQLKKNTLQVIFVIYVSRALYWPSIFYLQRSSIFHNPDSKEIYHSTVLQKLKLHRPGFSLFSSNFDENCCFYIC